MKIKEIYTKAGPLWPYLGYFLVVFLWYFLEDIYTSSGANVSGRLILTLLYWGFKILIVPIILAGVYGGIHARQQTSDTLGTSGFFRSAFKYYWRILLANLFSLLIYFVLVIAFVIAGFKGTDQETLNLLTWLRSPLSAIYLFWFSALVVEHKLFYGLRRGLKTLLLNPYALLIGIFWAGASALETILFDGPGNPTSLVVNVLRAGVLAALRIITIVYALAIYKIDRGEVGEVIEETAPADAPVTSTGGDGWVNVSFGLAFFAFIPIVNFLALIFGIIALWRKKRFVVRAVIACCSGAFFTIFYFLAITGLVASSLSPAKSPGYGFLVEANPAMKQQVDLLEHGTMQKIVEQLEQNPTGNPDQHWTVDAVSAIARYKDRDFDGAFNDFQLAAKKQPERSEFYYYYGLALLEDKKTELAAEQFKAALAHTPKLEVAQRHLDLINAAYTPPFIVSSLLSIFVLLILFTLHELGHAYSAWKLGDDTAKNQGRLTLNPIAHLDLFGSIILPGLLIWQHADIVFGWAKPVPINTANFQNPKKDQMRVSFAGPAVNLIISLVCFIILGFLMLFVRLLWPDTLTMNLAAPFASVSIVGPPMAQVLVYIVVFLKQMFYSSLMLGCFNLLPVPPLDGSWILSGLLPDSLSVLFEKVRRFGFLLFFLMVLTHISDSVMVIPLTASWGGLEVLFYMMGFR